jgi:hypothetical protein
MVARTMKYSNEELKAHLAHELRELVDKIEAGTVFNVEIEHGIMREWHDEGLMYDGQRTVTIRYWSPPERGATVCAVDMTGDRM